MEINLIDVKQYLPETINQHRYTFVSDKVLVLTDEGWECGCYYKNYEPSSNGLKFKDDGWLDIDNKVLKWSKLPKYEKK